MLPGMAFFPGLGWAWPQQVPGRVATAFCDTPGHWVPLNPPRVLYPAQQSGPIQLSPEQFKSLQAAMRPPAQEMGTIREAQHQTRSDPVTQKEAALFMGLNVATNKQMLYSWQADRLDLWLAQVWMISYLNLAGRSQIFSGAAFGSRLAGDVLNTIGSAFSGLAAGPAGFLVGLAKGVIGLVAGAFEANAKIQQREARSKAINANILQAIGPAPEPVGRYLLHWWSVMRARAWADKITEEENELYGLFCSWLPEFGILGLFRYLNRNGTYQPPPPLPANLIAWISRAWFRPNAPCQFLPVSWFSEKQFPLYLRPAGAGTWIEHYQREALDQAQGYFRQIKNGPEYPADLWIQSTPPWMNQGCLADLDRLQKLLAVVRL